MSVIVPDARDVHERQYASDPRDWYIEVCSVCGCQLGPGIGSRTQTGRCVVESHRGQGGMIVRVIARPLAEQREFTTHERMKRWPDNFPTASFQDDAPASVPKGEGDAT